MAAKTTRRMSGNQLGGSITLNSIAFLFKHEKCLIFAREAWNGHLQPKTPFRPFARHPICNRLLCECCKAGGVLCPSAEYGGAICIF